MNIRFYISVYLFSFFEYIIYLLMNLCIYIFDSTIVYNLHFVILYSYIHIVYDFYSVFYALSILSYTYIQSNIRYFILAYIFSRIFEYIIYLLMNLCIYIFDSTIVIIIYISLSYIVIYISYMISTQFFTLFLKYYRTLIYNEYSILY